MFHILSRLFNYNAHEIARIQTIVARIASFEDEMRNLQIVDFVMRTNMLRTRLRDGETFENVLPEAFALVREAARRVYGMRHFDTQLIAGVALHEGKIAEQKTGEGKTLTATAPLYLNALAGKGVHLVTVNDYLARRDAGWMGAIFAYVGMSTSCIIADASFIYDTSYINDEQDERLRHLRPCTRQEAYKADITYGINSEFGFDYLRDNMQTDAHELAQRGFYYAIVDEADSVLIDEARTPHIISSPVERDVSKYYIYAKVVRGLVQGADYTLDEKARSVNLTDGGLRKIEKILGLQDMYQDDFETIFHVEAALKAEVLFKNNKDYIVNSAGEVVIVDEFTGRLLEGRRFSEGIHQAIEAKEGVGIKQESRTLATVSLQNYFRMYTKLAGMTGTAATEAEEFTKIYSTDVLVIPTHRTMVRKDFPDMIFKTERAKFNAVAQEVAKQHKIGRPVLIGTTSIEKNEYLSHILDKIGVPHELLNAKNHQREAIIIAKAGQKGSVTLATNMAGRGVDIIIDEESKKRGGLCVIGTERHESRRIDNQLRGRSGRQGDPGSTQIFVSLEDDLMRIFGGEQIARLMTTLQFPEDEPLSHSLVSSALNNAQKKVEGHNFDIRKHLVEFDDVLNKQREIVYSMRAKILLAESADDTQANFAQKVHTVVLDCITDFQAVEPDRPSDEQYAHMRSLFKLPDDQNLRNILYDENALESYVITHIHTKNAAIGRDIFWQFARHTMLITIDQLWTEHLTSIEDLRQGINLRGYAQMDPLVEYKNEAFRLFESLIANIHSESVHRVCTAEIDVATLKSLGSLSEQSKQMVYTPAQAIQYNQDEQSVTTTQSIKPIENHKSIGRNDPCYCGSGKKFKKCHGA